MSDIGYFNHPFDMENRMRLLDDIGLAKPLSEESLECNFDAVQLQSSKGRQNAKSREEISDESIFDLSQSINSVR